MVLLPEAFPIARAPRKIHVVRLAAVVTDVEDMLQLGGGLSIERVKPVEEISPRHVNALVGEPAQVQQSVELVRTGSPRAQRVLKGNDLEVRLERADTLTENRR